MAEFDFENSFGRLLGMAHTAMFRHLSKVMKENELPITPDQFRVLTFLWTKDGQRQNDLAVCSNRNRANVTRIIHILEREGIVERRNDPNDSRVSRIYLTNLGKSLREKTVQCAEQSIQDALKGITPNQRQICEATLLKITQNLS